MPLHQPADGTISCFFERHCETTTHTHSQAHFIPPQTSQSNFCERKYDIIDILHNIPLPLSPTCVNATLANASRPTQRKQRTLARGTSNALYSYAHEGCKGQFWVDFMIHTHRAVSWRVCGGTLGRGGRSAPLAVMDGPAGTLSASKVLEKLWGGARADFAWSSLHNQVQI